jgi:hypothetical protein
MRFLRAISLERAWILRSREPTRVLNTIASHTHFKARISTVSSTIPSLQAPSASREDNRIYILYLQAG